MAGLIPLKASVLDVGCGDGNLAYTISQKRVDLDIKGIDVLIRKQTYIPVSRFDGSVIPYDDGSFDIVMMVDVLHHSENPNALLLEASCVARNAILLKDHTRDGMLAELTLKFMDWVGNRRHGVELPYNYWSKQEWAEAVRKIDLEIEVWENDLKLFPGPFSLMFDRSLHFFAKLRLS
jgi:SAM-dependent methyltransferase